MSRVFRDGLFAGKVAFFTGGTSGIALRIAEVFAELGATVVLNGRKQDKLDAAVAGIAARGGKAAGFACDVRDYGAIAGALARTRETYGPIDFLFCAAAGNFPAPVLGMSANGFKAVVDIDLLGTFNTCRAAHEHLSKPGAVVINISANHGHQAYPLQAHVCAAKAGVDLLTKTLAMEWGPHGIRVNGIAPGPIDDTEGMRRLAPTGADRQRVIGMIPAGRMGTRDDVAQLAVFLCSDAASFLTGAIYRCDGGQALTGPRALAQLEHTSS
ncbi:MAG: SDR family oxidoreductase [Acidobacteria bacterium]|nr:SDR family oxidoreductase [Acidobacteriota bacterium]